MPACPCHPCAHASAQKDEPFVTWDTHEASSKGWPLAAAVLSACVMMALATGLLLLLEPWGSAAAAALHASTMGCSSDNSWFCKDIGSEGLSAYFVHAGWMRHLLLQGTLSRFAEGIQAATASNVHIKLSLLQHLKCVCVLTEVDEQQIIYMAAVVGACLHTHATQLAD